MVTYNLTTYGYGSHGHMTQIKHALTKRQMLLPTPCPLRLPSADTAWNWHRRKALGRKIRCVGSSRHTVVVKILPQSAAKVDPPTQDYPALAPTPATKRAHAATSRTMHTRKADLKVKHRAEGATEEVPSSSSEDDDRAASAFPKDLAPTQLEDVACEVYPSGNV